mmetsp:Transcript_9230/g.11635  ORF Transcript_9230/g.11635 Transcript_9230/m.11635 type:complete len:164 (-) Transcript_9230:294-785(-)
MNSDTFVLSTPSRIAPRKKLSPVSSAEETHFGPQSYQTPQCCRYLIPTSPPRFYRQHKRIRRDIFQNKDGEIYPEFLIPDLNEEDLNITSITPVRLSLKLRVSHFDLESTLRPPVDNITSTTSMFSKKPSLVRKLSYCCDTPQANKPLSCQLKRRLSSSALTA